MDNRQRTRAVLQYKSYDRLPVVHFGYWDETIAKWHAEGHITHDEIKDVRDGSQNEKRISEKLGFDYNWYNTFQDKSGLGSLYPAFKREVIDELGGGLRKVINEDGVIVIEKEGVRSIPSEVDHILKDRKSWEKHYLPKLQFNKDRVDMHALSKISNREKIENPIGIYCGSLFGQIRNWMGIEGISYLYVDDPELFDEIINTVGELCFRVTETILFLYPKFDFAHFWEDICFKNGPLVAPEVYKEKVGPHYRRITDMVKNFGIDIVSLDCDGFIDALLPVWIENGVNTMFPIEVGTWNGNIKPWREKYGCAVRGVGGMNKNLFAMDHAAIDREIERLKPLIELGGYIPCPDHRIPPDAKWENVHYYCNKMRKIFG